MLLWGPIDHWAVHFFVARGSGCGAIWATTDAAHVERFGGMAGWYCRRTLLNYWHHRWLRQLPERSSGVCVRAGRQAGWQADRMQASLMTG